MEPSGPPPARSSSLDSGMREVDGDVRARVVVVPDQMRLLGRRLEHLQQLLVVTAQFVHRRHRAARTPAADRRGAGSAARRSRSRRPGRHRRTGPACRLVHRHRGQAGLGRAPCRSARFFGEGIVGAVAQHVDEGDQPQVTGQGKARSPTGSGTVRARSCDGRDSVMPRIHSAKGAASTARPNGILRRPAHPIPTLRPPASPAARAVSPPSHTAPRRCTAAPAPPRPPSTPRGRRAPAPASCAPITGTRPLLRTS